jgi:hypothetical protein
MVFKTDNGHYLCAEGCGGREVVANRPGFGDWEIFHMKWLPNGNVAAQAFNGQFLCAEGGGGREVVANRDAIGPWETLGWKPSTVFGADQVDPEGWLVEWERAFLLPEPDYGSGFGSVHDSGEPNYWGEGPSGPPFEKVSMRAANGQFLCAEGGGGREVVANRDAIGPWETFSVVTPPPELFNKPGWGRSQ